MKKKKDNKKFIERTIKALDQHGRRLEEGEISYDRTLFINACVGLLLVPNASIYDKLPNVCIDEWGIPADRVIIKNKDGQDIEEQKTVREIIRHLRNAIAHNRFDFNSGENHGCECVPLDDIDFVDVNDSAKRNKIAAKFALRLSYNEFKAFIEKVAHYAIDNTN